jgi:hypothetical protein
MGLSRNASRKSEDFLGSISERVLIFESGKERGEKGSVGTRNAHVTISRCWTRRLGREMWAQGVWKVYVRV